MLIATFQHPHCEMYGAGAVFEGEAAVRGYLSVSRVPSSDESAEIIAMAQYGGAVRPAPETFLHAALECEPGEDGH